LAGFQVSTYGRIWVSTEGAMLQTHYQGLPEHGLPLVPPEAPEFPELVRDIQSRPQPFGNWPTGDLTSAAVLLNQTGRAIVTLTYFWRYTLANRQKRTNTFSNLGSSMQMDFLSGRSTAVPQDLGSFILAGSKRLLTQQGMYGNNLDVLPPQPEGCRGGGYTGSTGGGFHWGAEITEVELVLDTAILEDGLCVGPDEGGLVERLTEELEQQRSTAQQVVEALRNGASPGQVFEILMPLARHQRHPPQRTGERGRVTITHPTLLRMFAQTGIHQLTNQPEQMLVEWFEGIAESEPVRLHRPTLA
jgi:hypothetical protein